MLQRSALVTPAGTTSPSVGGPGFCQQPCGQGDSRVCEEGPSKAGMRLVSISSEAHLKIRKACEEVAALQNTRWPSEGSAQKGPHLSVRSIFFKIKMNHSWLLGAAPGWGWGMFQHSSTSTTSRGSEGGQGEGPGQARAMPSTAHPPVPAARFRTGGLWVLQSLHWSAPQLGGPGLALPFHTHRENCWTHSPTTPTTLGACPWHVASGPRTNQPQCA